MKVYINAWFLIYLIDTRYAVDVRQLEQLRGPSNGDRRNIRTPGHSQRHVSGAAWRIYDAHAGSQSCLQTKCSCENMIVTTIIDYLLWDSR